MTAGGGAFGLEDAPMHGATLRRQSVLGWKLTEVQKYGIESLSDGTFEGTSQHGESLHLIVLRCSTGESFALVREAHQEQALARSLTRPAAWPTAVSVASMMAGYTYPVTAASAVAAPVSCICVYVDQDAGLKVLVGALAYYIASEAKVTKIAYLTSLTSRYITDGCALQVLRAIRNLQGKGDVDNGCSAIVLPFVPTASSHRNLSTAALAEGGFSNLLQVASTQRAAPRTAAPLMVPSFRRLPL